MSRIDTRSASVSSRTRVVLDIRALREPGEDRGLGRYTRALRAAVQGTDDYDIVEYAGRAPSRHRLSQWLDIPHCTRFLTRYGPYYHATSAYHLDPTHLRTTVVSIQDVIPLELPSYRQTGVKAFAFFSWARRCPVIITSSQYSAQRITTKLGYPTCQIVVAPLPVPLAVEDAGSCRDCQQIPPLPEMYVTSLVDVVTLDPRKRLPWILGAAEEMATKAVPVVLIGNGTLDLDAQNVIGLGRLCDYHTRRVLAGAECFLYASAYEGQGLPPQEALCEGTPVVAFRNTSLPEMIGPGTSWIDELDEAWVNVGRESRRDPQSLALAEAALSICGDRIRRDSLSAAGREHMAGFARHRFAAGVMAAYRMLTDKVGARV